MPLKMFNEKEQKPQKKIKYIIGVAAGKGGVGKSSVTVGLADALYKKGYRVGVMDTDIYGPSVRRMLPEDQMPVQKGDVITPASCRGIKMISMAYFRKEGEAAVVRAPIANGIIQQFLKQVDWGDLDYLLIDFPPGTGDVQLTLSQQAQLTGAVIVTTPQEVALMDVRKAMHMFHQVHIPILGIVENMSYFWHEKTEEKIYVFGKGGGEKLSEEFAVPFLGAIPLVPELCSCADQGRSIFQQDNLGSKAFQLVCKHLLEQVEAANPALQAIRINQKDAHHFEVEWADGEVDLFKLSDLQKNCSCAACVDEFTGKRLLDERTVSENVKAISLQTVGRYGLRIQFTEGCSSGIYSFEMLRALGGAV